MRRYGIAALVLSLGVLPVAAQEAKPEAPAPPSPEVKAIQDAGGKVEIDEKAEGKPVTQVNFATLPVGDDVLAHIKGFAGLQKLTLNNTKVTDAGMDVVKEIAGLQKLYLVDTGITDAGVEKLKGLEKLEILSLVGTAITDASVEHIKAMPGLKVVFLAGTKVTDEAIKKLKEEKKDLKLDR